MDSWPQPRAKVSATYVHRIATQTATEFQDDLLCNNMVATEIRYMLPFVRQLPIFDLGAHLSEKE